MARRWELSTVLVALALVLALADVAFAADKVTKPLAVPPDQYWDGDDGPWSTFGVQVGTPPQALRVLPATAGTATWIVLPEGCIERYPDNCKDLRGALFMVNESSTWQNQGLYELSVYEEKKNGYGGNGLYAYETLTAGWSGSGLPTLREQVVAGLATDKFWIGSFPLSPYPVNFTTMNDPKPSLLESLRNESKIPSKSWGYTAGGYGHAPKIYGSLTLGGYDASRFTPNKLNFTMYPDVSRELQLAVKSITTTATDSALMSNGIFTFINSQIPHIWLPKAACDAFEQAFGLTYDNGTDLYFVSDDQHDKLVSQNPSVTFKLAPEVSSSESVDIVMPYWAFDLTATPPLIGNKTLSPLKYFPIRRAANDTQYTLGRAFLQSAYVISNYEYMNFSVSQALFPTPGAAQKLVALLPQGSDQGGDSGLGTGAIAGIAVAAGVILILSIAAFFFIRRRRNAKRKAAESEAKEPDESGTLHPPGVFAMHEAEGSDSRVELGARMSNEHKAELAGDENTKYELGDDGKVHAELEDVAHAKNISMQETPLFEMPANEDVILPELDSATQTPRSTTPRTPYGVSPQSSTREGRLPRGAIQPGGGSPQLPAQDKSAHLSPHSAHSPHSPGITPQSSTRSPHSVQDGRNARWREVLPGDPDAPQFPIVGRGISPVHGRDASPGGQRISPQPSPGLATPTEGLYGRTESPARRQTRWRENLPDQESQSGPRRT